MRPATPVQAEEKYLSTSCLDSLRKAGDAKGLLQRFLEETQAQMQRDIPYSQLTAAQVHPHPDAFLLPPNSKLLKARPHPPKPPAGAAPLVLPELLDPASPAPPRRLDLESTSIASYVTVEESIDHSSPA